MNSYISEWIAIRYGKDLSVNEMENAFTESPSSSASPVMSVASPSLSPQHLRVIGIRASDAGWND